MTSFICSENYDIKVDNQKGGASVSRPSIGEEQQPVAVRKPKKNSKERSTGAKSRNVSSDAMPSYSFTHKTVDQRFFSPEPGISMTSKFMKVRQRKMKNESIDHIQN